MLEETEDDEAEEFTGGLFDRQSVQPKTRFYKFLIDFVGENFMLEELEQPTALQLYEALEVWQEKHDVDPVIGKPEIDWLISREITKEKFITWKELNPPEGKKAEKGKMTLGTLATRLDSWFTNRRCTLP